MLWRDFKACIKPFLQLVHSIFYSFFLIFLFCFVLFFIYSFSFSYVFKFKLTFCVYNIFAQMKWQFITLCIRILHELFYLVVQYWMQNKFVQMLGRLLSSSSLSSSLFKFVCTFKFASWNFIGVKWMISPFYHFANYV